MQGLSEKQAKAERIEIRVTPAVKALLTVAAQARHTTVSDFLLTNGIEAAERAVAAPTVFYASEEGWSAIHQMLDEQEAADPAEVVTWLTKQRRRD